MMILDQQNFSVRTMHKNHSSSSAPKDRFYADIKICFVLRGEAVWEIEEQTYPVAVGDVIFLNMGQRRCFTFFGKEGFDLGIFHLSRKAFSDLHHFMYFRRRVAHGKNVLHSPTLAALLLEVYEDWKSDAPFRYEFAAAKLSEFFIKAERLESDALTPLPQNDCELLHLLDEIDSSATRGIRLQTAAQMAGMTESTFSRRFFSLTGISFHEYVTEKKMQHALFLLKTTDHKVIDVALESGFNSVSGFYSAFQKRFGTTPNKISWDEL